MWLNWNTPFRPANFRGPWPTILGRKSKVLVCSELALVCVFEGSPTLSRQIWPFCALWERGSKIDFSTLRPPFHLQLLAGARTQKCPNRPYLGSSQNHKNRLLWENDKNFRNFGSKTKNFEKFSVKFHKLKIFRKKAQNFWKILIL